MSCSPPAAIVEFHAPASAGDLTLFTPFRCERLHAVIPVRVCLLRQAVSARQRTETNTWRGQGSDFPTCTKHCAQGAALRRNVSGAASVGWRGAGANGRVASRRSPGELAAEEAARRRLRVVGLLDPQPSMDEPPQEPEDGA